MWVCQLDLEKNLEMQILPKLCKGRRLEASYAKLKWMLDLNTVLKN